MTGNEPTERALDGVERLCRRAAWLATHADSPLKRLRLQAGELTVELEWPAVETGPPATGPTTAIAPAPTIDPTAGIDLAAGRSSQPDDTSFIVPSPLVGTFYRGPSPGAPPFVDIGQPVAAGQQVAIVEAMKLMNSVEVDRPGIVVDLLVADGTPVEYGQALFVIAPA